MEMKRIIVILNILILFLSFNIFLQSQHPPCWPEYNELTFKYEHLPYTPYLTTDMPYDVLIGYIALDSVRKNIREADLLTFLSRQSYNDTLRYIMKYLYKMVDYNPILFALTTSHWHERGSILLSDFIYHVQNSVFAFSTNPYLDKLLLKSGIIAHILVEDTLNVIDSSSQYSTVSIVTCAILDTIKGKVMPEAKVININPFSLETSTNESVDLPDNYLQFSYCLEWGRVQLNQVSSDDVGYTLIDDDGNVIYPPRMMDSTGSGWVKKGKEYIVFLDFHLICKDINYSYLTQFPFLMYSATCNVYPIENGFVIDPVNEIGFGESVEVNNFKNLLKQRINTIINFGE